MTAKTTIFALLIAALSLAEPAYGLSASMPMETARVAARR